MVGYSLKKVLAVDTPLRLMLTMITVELSEIDKLPEGISEVEIFCDAEGLALLSRQIGHLIAGSSHVHLMTPSWAGDELGEQPYGKNTILINHLRITRVPSE